MRFPVQPITSWRPMFAIAMIVALGVLRGVDARSAPPQDGPDRPRIVQVTPADGATDVEPVTEIRLRFDRPMDPTRMLLEWIQKEGGFRLRGEARYSADTHELILPVRLMPGTRHKITAGRKSFVRPGEFEGFESAGHVAAEPFSWSFTTVKPVNRGGPAPRVVSTSPPPNTEIARLTLLEVTFDRAMDPAGYGLELVDPSDVHDRQLAMIGQPDYDPAKFRFTMRLSLPANWNGDVALKGFRSQDGVEAKPMVLAYRTRRRIVSEALQAEIDRAGQAPEVLRQLVEKVRETRRKLTSVSEDVLSTSTHGVFTTDWYQHYQTDGSHFAMQGDRKFVAEVDAIMGIPFRVGSDGVNCWWRRKDKQGLAPFDAVAEKNVSICDTFDARNPADADRIIRERKLIYAGETVVRGRRCHRIRSWNLDERPTSWVGQLLEWSIDAETFLPARVEALLLGEFRSSYAIDFTFSRVNQPIPDEAFRLQGVPGAPQPKPEPEALPEGYTRRFLNVRDGGAGRMSVRWGMIGPKGRMSNGLN